MRVLLSILCLLLTFGGTIVAVEDGLYQTIEQSCSGSNLVGAGSRTVLVSKSNANDVFNVNIIFHLAAIPEDHTYALVLNGHFHRMDSSTDDHEYVLGTYIPAEDLKAAERLLGVAAIIRHHPGFLVDGCFDNVKAVYHAGEAIVVIFTFKNVGKHVLTFWPGGSPGSRTLDFSGRRDGQTLTPILSMDGIRKVCGSFEPIVLKPDEAYTETVDLRTWFAFDQPGFYRVRGNFPFDVYAHGGVSAWADILTRDISFTLAR